MKAFLFLLVCLLPLWNFQCVSTENYKISNSNTNVSSVFELVQLGNVINNQLGVDVVDPVGHYIGDNASHEVVFRGGWEPWPRWSPLSRYKRILVGTLDKFEYFDEDGDACDINNVIIPDDEFRYIIDEVVNEEYVDLDKFIDCGSGNHNCLECEITPDEHFYEMPWFPKSTGDSPLAGKKIGVYGPWVVDCGHGCRPEIHPTEMIWWRDENSYTGEDDYYLMLIQDDSNRFDREEDFTGTIEHPWSKSPRAGKFRIAFEIDISNPFIVYNYDVFPLIWWKVKIDSDEPLLRDVDDGVSHSIEYDGRVVLTVNERSFSPFPIDEDLGIGFEQISRNEENTLLRGFITFTSMIGFGDRGDEGILLLLVQKSQNNNAPTAYVQHYPSPKSAQIQVRRLPQSIKVVPESLRNLSSDLQLYSDTISSLRIKKAFFNNSTGQLEKEFVQENSQNSKIIGSIKNIGLFDGGTIQIETDSGKVGFVLPEIGLTPSFTNITSKQFEDDQKTWNGYLKSFRKESNLDEFKNTFKKLNQVSLKIEPKYVFIKEGRPALEEASPITDTMNNTLLGPKEEIRNMFGTVDVIKSKFSFKAKNIITGKNIKISQGRINKSKISVQILERNSNLPLLIITFPKDTSLSIYELEISVEQTDVFGNKGKNRKFLYSHALMDKSDVALFESTIGVTTELLNVDFERVLTASDFTNLQKPSTKDDEFDRRAGILRQFGRMYVQDSIVDIIEFNKLHRLTKQCYKE